MILYFLYRVGYFLANTLSVKGAYAIACAMADIHYKISPKDRAAVFTNLKVILQPGYDKSELERKAKEVFRNFAKYLVDFFRFNKVDEEYLRQFVKIEGLEHVDEGLSKGKGVILLSAHIGNWELGGLVSSLLRGPMCAVVLTHNNKKINDFFTRQRKIGHMQPVEIGISLRSCFKALKKNGLLALLGDRDFSNRGYFLDFFGNKALIPKGPAAFSCRMGSCIVPCFMIREVDDTFRMIYEPPIFPIEGQDDEEAIITLTKKYLSVIEAYVRRYPTQWYMFREVWGAHG